MATFDTTGDGPGAASLPRRIPDGARGKQAQVPPAVVARTLRDGRRVRLRAPRAADRAQVEACFERLSPDSRRLRFFVAKRALTDAELEFFTLADGQDHIAVAALALGRDGLETRIHGMARCIRDKTDPRRAELALAVADDVQGLGLGRLLIEQLGRAAHAQGIERFTLEALRENAGMRALVQRLGGVAVHREDDSLHYEIPIAFADVPETPAPRPGLVSGDTPDRPFADRRGFGPGRETDAWDIPLPWHWPREADDPFRLLHGLAEMLGQWTWEIWLGGVGERTDGGSNRRPARP